MKQFVLAIMGLFAGAAAGEEWVRDFPAPAATLAEEGAYASVSVAEEGYLLDADAVGRPALPQRCVRLAVPDRMAVTGVTWSVAWEALASAVKILPLAAPARVGEEASAPAEDAAVYGGAAPYPAAPVTVGAEERMAGVRTVTLGLAPFRWHPASGRLERAARLTLRVAFGPSAARSYVLAPKMLASVRDAVANPEAVALKAAAPARHLALGATAAARTDPVDYLLLSPPDFVADWNWYVERRREVHTNIVFRVKNTAEIYAEHPFGGTNLWRNAAESIHAYLRAQREKMGFSYVVLGGAWLDAQNRKNTSPHFYGGELMSLSNCVPGVYGYPREEWREIPSDMFYACLDLKDGQTYPWDANGDNVYIDQNDCAKNDLRPDVCVTRITLNPYRPNGWTAYNRHALVTNYVEKLARGEDKRFSGHFRYGLAPDSTGSRRLRANGDRMYYDELEFYDSMYNMPDPRHSDWIEDNEVEPRRRIKDQFAKWRPVLEAKGMMNYTWTKGFSSLSAATADYYASNRDYGFVYSHGWAQGATHFQAYGFATGRGLTLLNGSNGPCDTGYVDYHVNMNGVATLQYNLGDSGVTNPDGGALASINNTRWGWAGGSHTGLDFDSSMSYFMLNRSLVGFNQLYCDVGHAWFKGVSDYAAFNFTQGGGTHTWTLTEQICYGDPLVRLPAPEDRWWTGGATGVWDTVAHNWTNVVDDTLTYYTASNVYFTAATDTAITVTEPVGALRLSIPILTQAVFSITGASNGNLRVMRAIDVAGGDLRLNVPGGVGHDGISFARKAWNTHDPVLTLEGTEPFYVAKVTGAGRLELKGGGVTLDVDKFPTNHADLVCDGPGVNYLPHPNILRSRQADGLARFGSLALTNTYVKLETTDGFGRGAPRVHTLASSRLEIAANAFYTLKSSYQKDGYAEKLSATFDVAGDSFVTSSEGGLWTVSRTTAFNLASNATLALSAETKDCGGKIVFTGAGEVRVKSASALAGAVEVGAGVTLVLDELPLAAVTSLTVADGAQVVIPEAKSGYWQILPVSSRFTCGTNVPFFTSGNRVTPIAGQASPAGAFFRDGALYAWREADTHWTDAIAHTKPKILFGDLGANAFTVRVDLAVAPSFVSFANAATAYRFRADEDAPDAAVTFSSVILNGPTRFDLPVAATEYAEILGGTAAFRRLVAPTLTVGAGAALALTGSHWTKIVLQEGAGLKALPGERLDWNFETTLVRAGTSPTAIDVSALALDETPQILIAGTGHAWTRADLADFTLTGQPAEFRLVDGALAVVRGAGLEAPYALDVAGATNWNNRAWRAANGPFPDVWSNCVLACAGDVRLVATGETARVTLDTAAAGGTLALANASNGVFTLAAEAGAPLDFATLDLADAQGRTVLDVETGGAAILAPTNAEAVCELLRAGSGPVTMRDGTLYIARAGVWTLAAGAQGTARVFLAPTNRVMTLVKLGAGFEYPCGGFDLQVVDATGAKRTDCTVAQVGDALVAVPDVLDVGDVDFAALAENAVAGAPYAHALVAGGVSGTVALTNLPAALAGDGTNVTVETSGAYGVRLVVRAPAVRLGSIGINFAGGRNGETNLADARVADHAQYGALMHGAQPVAGTNWNDVAAANGSYVARRVVRRDGTVETNAAVAVKVTNVANPYTTGYAVGDQILFGYLDDAKSPVVELSGIPFARYRVIAYRATDNQNVVFSSCRIGADAASARAYYGASARGRTPVVTLSGDTNMGWGDTTVRDALIEGVNYVVSDVLTGGTAYVASPKHTGRACLAALQIVEVAGAVQAEESVPDTALREVRATVGDGDWNWQALPWKNTNGDDVAAIDWSAIRRATVTGTSNAVVTLDVPSYAGVAALAGGVELAVHALPAFTLATGSVGRVEARLVSAPTADGTTLLRTEEGFHPTNAACAVALRDQFGAPFVAPVSVAWTEGRYYLLVQNLDAPNYRHTFTGTVTDPNWNSTGLPETSDPAYFEDCREDGQALVNWYRGSTRSALMDPFPASWTLNIVARTPNNRNGVLFAFGYGAYTPKGFAFVSDGTDRAGLAVWRGWGESYRLAASVPLATSQFHCYTVTYDGAALKFYVDGALAAERADTEGFTYVNGALNGKIGWFQFWGVCSGKYPGALGGASGGAIDDWSFYRTCLTPESVEALAARFPVWPGYHAAQLYVDTAWEDLDWSDLEEEDGLPRLLASAGGTLVLRSPCTLTTGFVVEGAKLPIRLEGEGVLEAPNGLYCENGFSIDASALDGAALAARAVYGLPYSRWLVRGPLAAGEADVKLPSALPHGYAVRAETVPGYGVRLVVTAPWFAKFGSLNFNFAGGDKNTDYAEAKVATHAAYSDKLHGAFPVVGTAWSDLSAKNAENVAAQGVTLTVSQVANPYYTKAAVGDQILYGYVDDSQHPTVTVTNIPYAQFRVVVYTATDNAGTSFAPVQIGATAADAAYYFGPTRAQATGGATVAGATGAIWGDSDVRGALAEGVNYVVSDVIAGVPGEGTCHIHLQKISGARACLAAFQIVEVGRVFESSAVDYTAVVTNDTPWAQGDGPGLAHDVAWMNDTNSLVTLVADATRHTVVLDTAITASVVKVSSHAGERLGLVAPADVPHAIGALDLSATRGETVFTNAWPASIPVTTAAGTRLRFEQAATAPLFTQADAVVAYRAATFATPPSPFDYVLATDDPGDAIDLPFTGYTSVAFDVGGGVVTLGQKCDQMICGGVASTGTNSVIAVNGGTFRCRAGGDGQTKNTRGLIFGNTGSCNVAPRIVVNDGLFDMTGGVVTLWQKAGLAQNGGTVRLRGLFKGSNSAGFATLAGGRFELGDLGIARYTLETCGTFTFTLAGGELRAVASSAVAVAANLTRPSTVAATNGTVLTFREAVTGGGGLTVGAPGCAGEVAFASDASRLGAVTLAAGKLTVPLAALTGDLALADGTTLDLAWTPADGTTPICAGAFAEGADVTVTLNGAPLPDYVRREGKNLIATGDAHTWTNPVTQAAADFTFRFRGTSDAAWANAANWDRYVGIKWQTSDKAPFMSGTYFAPAVIDGRDLADDRRAVTLAGTLEGWTPRLAVLNGASATIASVNKFQSQGGPMWLWVDETSQLTFGSFGGNSYDSAIQFYVAASNGLVFAANPAASAASGADSTDFQYHLKGAGTVEYPGVALTKCTHRICRADFRLTASGAGQVVRTKPLVLFASATVAFVTTNAAVAVEDAAGEITEARAVTNLTAYAALGSFAITQREDGVWIDYVDRAPSARYVHAVEEGDGVHRVEIPIDWIMQLTNATVQALAPQDALTPGRLAEALESASPARGLKPWESYVLGLEPTNASDRITAHLTAADGRIHVEARGLEGKTLRGISGVRYVLESTDDLLTPFTTLRTAQDATAFEDVAAESSDRHFYRIRVELVW